MNASLEIQLEGMKIEFKNQLRDVEVEAESLQSMLDEKMVEIAEKNAMIEGLKKIVENLEADVTDKTKVVNY